jgi:cellulose synthase/poly-beta-1,6-N-acetylglucosamine synthase-like glycosyltransferase
MAQLKVSGSANQSSDLRIGSGVTVIVPAYNEAASIVDTIKSIQGQTVPADEIIVIDDFSTDNTGDLARECGATVLRPPANTGSKAGAQNFALKHVQTTYVMAIDADTTLAPDAIAKLLPALNDPNIAAACGFVLPRHVETLWERGRYIEYVFAFTFYKSIQDYYNTPLISSGCFSVYRTDILHENRGWSTRTMAEDMDLTWSFYQAGHGVRFVPEAVCYPIEPHDFNFMSKQLRRWSHGFVQNVRLHWKSILEIPFLRMMVAVALWDATVASMTYIFLLPLLAIFLNPFFLLGYLIDLPAVVVPVLYKSVQRKEVRRAVASLPGFFVLRMVNCMFLLKAVWQEFVMHRPLKIYEKGH